MGSTVIDSEFFKDLFGTEEMRQIFSECNVLQKWLDVEAALARVQGRLDIIPQEAAEAISQHANADALSIEVIKKEIDVTRHPTVPLIRELQRHCPGNTGEYIHWGATTQDIIDTGLILQLKEAYEVIVRDMLRLEKSMIKLAGTHKHTIMAGRTHGQQALPITFGYKVAVWASEAGRHIERLEQCKPRLLVGQLSGGAGTLASLGEQALEVHRLFMDELGLYRPDITWHTARDGLAEFVCILGMISSSLSKAAHEIVLLQKTEVAEVEEQFGKGQVGSSTMPQKRNPAGSEQIVAASKIVRGLVVSALDGMQIEHERDGGSYHAEWHYLPEVCILVHGAIKEAIRAMENLNVKPENMRRNLDVSKGLIMSEAIMIRLAQHLGRQTAHDVVYRKAQRAFREGLPLKDTLLQSKEVEEHFTGAQIEEMIDPTSYTGLAPVFVDQVIEASQRARAAEG